jgi:hypothetical protein
VNTCDGGKYKGGSDARLSQPVVFPRKDADQDESIVEEPTAGAILAA